MEQTDRLLRWMARSVRFIRFSAVNTGCMPAPGAIDSGGWQGEAPRDKAEIQFGREDA